MIPRYSREEMASIFSERAKFSRWLEVEILAVEARVRLGEVPVDDLTETKEKAAFDVARIAEIEAVRHHDVVAFVENVRENIGDAGRHIHFGMTSSDVLDTATAVAIIWKFVYEPDPSLGSLNAFITTFALPASCAACTACGAETKHNRAAMPSRGVFMRSAPSNGGCP